MPVRSAASPIQPGRARPAPAGGAGDRGRGRRRASLRAHGRTLEPPLQDAELGLRASALAEAAKLQALFVERGLRTLTFAKSRKAAELIHRFTAERLGDDTQLSPYRAGYTAAQRREIERRLGEGELLGVSATNALELGIDVGLLDAVISVGFPGRSRPSASNGVAPAGATAGSPCSWRPRTRSTSTSCASRTKLLGRRVEAAILDPRAPVCSPVTCGRRRTRPR